MKGLIFLVSAAALLAAEVKLGKPLTLDTAVPVSTLMAKPDEQVGKVVQVKGKIVEVCQMAGCWMNLAGDDGKMVRIKVDDGDIVFPKDAVGKMAVAEGKLVKTELTLEQAITQARHEAEEAGRKFNPASIKSGRTTYTIRGTGAVLL